MKRIFYIAVLTFLSFAAQLASPTMTYAQVNITEAKGWFESAYVKFNRYNGAKTYNVYVKGGQYNSCQKLRIIRKSGCRWTESFHKLCTQSGTCGQQW